MPFGLRLGDLIIYFVLALLIFGPKKLPEIGAAVGHAISSFKNSIKGATDEIEVNETTALLEEHNLKLRRLELQSLEEAIASKQAELRVYATVPRGEEFSTHTDTEIQAN
jgi:sec-independent protein translocase protein TatA